MNATVAGQAPTWMTRRVLLIGGAAILLAVACQAWGLRSLLISTNEHEQWNAAAHQRQAVQQEWEALSKHLQAQVLELKSQVQQLGVESSNAAANRDKFVADLAGIKKEQELARQGLEGLLAEQKVARQQSIESEAIKQAAENRVRDLTGQHSKLTDEIATLSQERDGLIQSAESKRTELRTVQTQLDTIQKQLNETNTKLLEQQKAVAAGKAEVDSLLGDRGEVTTAVATAQQRLDGLNAAHAKISGELQTLQKETSDLERQHAAFEQAAKASRGEAAQLDQHLQSKRAELKSLQGRIDDARADEQRLVLSIRQLAPATQPTSNSAANSRPTTQQAKGAR